MVYDSLMLRKRMTIIYLTTAIHYKESTMELGNCENSRQDGMDHQWKSSVMSVDLYLDHSLGSGRKNCTRDSVVAIFG